MKLISDQMFDLLNAYFDAYADQSDMDRIVREPDPVDLPELEIAPEYAVQSWFIDGYLFVCSSLDVVQTHPTREEAVRAANIWSEGKTRIMKRMTVSAESEWKVDTDA